jgi:hypothetical protein
MLIIGCDFRPGWQQVAWLDLETGETGEAQLEHSNGEAERWYGQKLGHEGWVRSPPWPSW